MVKLSVNLNKVALLRNQRNLTIPSVVKAGSICLDAGAHGLTVHPRPDHRHIRPDDVYQLHQLLSRYPRAEFNIEGNPFHDYMPYVEKLRPTQCTLVPDEPGAVTSDHGWNLDKGASARLLPIVKSIKSLGCRVSLFLDPVPTMVERAAKLGVDRIELYTEPYAAAFALGDTKAVDAYFDAAERARELGLAVNAGHDLNLENLGLLVRKIPYLAEVSIGHALIADALEFGLAATVGKYLAAIKSA